jgi:hypothetical protein
MAERISRKALYDLVWSQAMKNLATQFGLSDVALKKACTRAGIPTPDRGYRILLPFSQVSTKQFIFSLTSKSQDSRKRPRCFILSAPR